MLKRKSDKRSNPEKEKAMKNLTQEDTVGVYFSGVPISIETKLNIFLSSQRMTKAEWLTEVVNDMKI